MSIQYIRDYYNVPAKVGGRVKITYKGEHFGTITGTHDAHLMIRLDGEKHSNPYHPTWEIEYLEEENARNKK